MQPRWVSHVVAGSTGLKTRPAEIGALAVARQQTRGMKVQSSIKKRCEHCKVSTAPGNGVGPRQGFAEHWFAAEGTATG